MQLFLSFVLVCFPTTIHADANFTTSAARDDYPRPFAVLKMNQDSNLTDPQINHRRRLASEQLAPLFHGVGVHYAFVWVGSPPQRVSVIVDTGSRHTAFPCVGCKCGRHVRISILYVIYNRLKYTLNISLNIIYITL